MGSREFQPEYDRFSDRYATMSDRELLEIALRSWELSDAAWEALEEELDRRGLEVPEPELPGSAAVLEQRTLVMLRRFRDIPEAMLAKGKLDSAGVESVLADDNMVRINWLWSNLLGGVKLMVDEEDFVRASAVLNESHPVEPELEDGDVQE